MTDLTKLRQVAEAATPGEWRLLGDRLYAPRDPSKPISFFDNSLELTSLCASSDDEDFIAEANPKTLLRLLDAIQVLREGLEHYKSLGRADLHEHASDALSRAEEILKGVGNG